MHLFAEVHTMMTLVKFSWHQTFQVGENDINLDFTIEVPGNLQSLGEIYSSWRAVVSWQMLPVYVF